MRHIIVATHGEMAKGIVHTAEFIMGKQECLHALAAYTQECLDFSKELNQLVEDLSKEGEVVVLTDLLGGSVNNEALSLLPFHKVHIITGVNLALVIQLLGSDADIPKSIEGAREAIMYCNAVIKEGGQETELDEF